MDDKRPILIGMNNPLSRDPEHALYPYPPGCTGNRIFQMLSSVVDGITEDEYLARFDRRNLVVGGPWSKQGGKLGAHRMLPDLENSERQVVLLGKDVQGAFDVRLPPLSFERSRGGFWIHTVPHPSGLNRWYNEGDNTKRVADLLARLYRE